MTNREIAQAMNIAETTVKTHLKNILEKLHARNRLEAAAIALRLGLTEFPADRKPRERSRDSPVAARDPNVQ
jgi:two-component system NarL family response regulator